MNTTFTKIISIKDVYGTDTPEIPKGYKAVEFRLPRKGEYYTPADSGEYYTADHVLRACQDHINITSLPYLILSKLPDPPVVVKGNVEASITTTVENIYGGDVTIPEGYEFVDFGIPKKGDTFVTCMGKTPSGTTVTWPDTASNVRIIIKKCS